MKILIVNDNDTNLKILKLILSKTNYEIKTANTAEMAIGKLSSDFDVIILDTNLPDKNGVEVCEEIRKTEKHKNTPIILISSNTNTDFIVKGLAAGANDYMPLPFKADDVLTRISNLIITKEKSKNVNQELSESQLETIFSLAKTAQSKDDDKGKHVERVKRYSVVLAEELRKPVYKTDIDDEFVKNLELASPLHDIGKVGISNEIILKPEKLNEKEFEEMKKHTLIGYNTLKEINEKFKNNKFIKMAMEIARSHHERHDGKGYPDGLKKYDIPLAARIVSVADVYDALRMQKSYKDSLSHEKSFEVIKGGRDLQFDYIVVKALKKVHHKMNDIWNELKD